MQQKRCEPRTVLVERDVTISFGPRFYRDHVERHGDWLRQLRQLPVEVDCGLSFVFVVGEHRGTSGGGWLRSGSTKARTACGQEEGAEARSGVDGSCGGKEINVMVDRVVERARVAGSDATTRGVNHASYRILWRMVIAVEHDCTKRRWCVIASDARCGINRVAQVDGE